MCDYDDELYHEHLPNVCGAMREKSKACCSINTVKRKLPILTWLPEYTLKFLIVDFVAGMTVGLTAVTQAIAYGAVAGLPPVYGLYSSFMGCFLYIIFGTCKDVTVGPTAIISMMVNPHVAGNPDYAVLICFLTGCIVLVLGFLNLGVLVRFISAPVIAGFTLSAALTVGSGQINNLFGIQSQSNEFLKSWINFFGHIQETRLNDALLGCCTLILLLFMRKLKDLKSCSCQSVLKYLSLCRNVLAVIIGILICYLMSREREEMPFRISQQITPGLPPFRAPPFETVDEEGQTVGFGEMISNLGSAVGTIPLLCILEVVSIAKAFSKGKIVDASQEMIALGFCNLFSSFFSSIPITGSFARSAINNASGVRTPLGGAFTGILILLSLAFLTQVFAYLPKATLAAIIISAMLFMVEYDTIAEIWRAKKRDMVPFVFTVICCLFWSLEYGMLVGVLINALFILGKSMTPQFQLESQKHNGLELCVAELKGNVDYTAAESLNIKTVAFVTEQKTMMEKTVALVIIKGSDIGSIDSTVALNLVSLRDDLQQLQCELICWNWNMAAAGVVCRLQRKARNMFRFTKNFSELLEMVANGNSKSESDNKSHSNSNGNNCHTDSSQVDQIS
ncbi:PREDICTED: sodium-independent sulfate anion transporter isoform X1 [Drosophila arizonae]|uniref:Sodium-independent sulfate anion transporter isoform X1 n=1 Tax=Drosophila arizonae TaxID=7263 RepID=A0ABM1NL00_DROAR|nr:PREDICTED: sodium-independent sulfate anion transporter isoform X1 [Drosophila arizonae]